MRRKDITTSGPWNNREFLHRSIIFEFPNNSDFHYYMLSLPPQNIEIEYPERISETKTFGGTILETYGKDTVRINISGTTANSELRFIAKSSEANNLYSETSEFLVTGTQELLQFNELIKTQYAETPCKIIMPWLHYGKTVFQIAFTNFLIFQGFFENFKITESKDNPMCKNYTFNFVGEQLDLKVGSGQKQKLSKKEALFKQFNYNFDFWNLKKYIKNFAEKYNGYLDEIDGSFGFAYEYVHNSILELKDIVNICIDMADRTELLALNPVHDTLNLLDEIQSFGDYVKSKTKRLNFFESIETIISNCQFLKEQTKKIKNNFDQMQESDVPVSVTQENNQSAKEVLQSISSLNNDMVADAEEIYVCSLKVFSQETKITIPGDSETDDQIITVYGTKEKTVKDSDTWDVLAAKEYNDPSYATMLANYNAIFNKKLIAGETIYIPLLDPGETFADNMVFNVPGIIDNYGKDIEINKNGDFDAVNGDLDFINGKDNLNQALSNRLKTTIDSRVRTVMYGIISQVGSINDDLSGFIMSSISETILQDPRVKQIDNISYEGRKDNLYINVTYKDINGNEQKVEGVY